MARENYITKTFTFEGKRYYVYGEDEKDVAVKIALKKRDLEEHKVHMTTSITVSEWAYKAVDSYKSNLKEITKTKYLQRLKSCVLSEIGSMKLSSVKPIDCQNVLNKQKGRSKTQVNEVYNQLKFIFRTAQENGLIYQSPAENIVKPSYYSGERRPITDYERKILYEVADKDHKFDLYLFMLNCGCRPSEAKNLKHTDLFKIDGVPVLHIRGTKTKKADRIVPCPQFLYDRYHSNKDTPLFETVTDKQYANKNLNPMNKRLYKQMNIAMGVKTYRGGLVPPLKLAADFTPYCLRHTYCTDLARKGVDIRTAQALMGHSTIEMTANIYTHILQEDIIKAAKVICTTPCTTPNATKTNQNTPFEDVGNTEK